MLSHFFIFGAEVLTCGRMKMIHATRTLNRAPRLAAALLINGVLTHPEINLEACVVSYTSAPHELTPFAVYTWGGMLLCFHR